MHMCLFVYSFQCMHFYIKYLCYFFRHVQGGPCGVLATVQAYILKHVLFTSSSSVVTSVYVIYCDLFIVTFVLI